MSELFIHPVQARERLIRQIVAEVCGRTSFGVTRLTFFRHDLDIRGPEEDAIGKRIERELEIAVPPLEWAYFRTVGQLCDYVELQIQRREATRG